MNTEIKNTENDILPVVKVSTVIMSHLSNANFYAESMLRDCMEFCKHLIIKFPDTNTRIDADHEWNLFINTVQ